MLSSQPSTGSLNSCPSNGHKNSSRPLDYPEKFKQNCTFSRKVFLNKKNYVYIIVTSLFELIECKGREVINYINLKRLLPVEIGSITDKDVDFEVILNSNTVVYALKIHSILIGVERSSSQLKILKLLSKVKSFECKLSELSSEPLLEVTFDDERKILTNFQDDDLENVMQGGDLRKFHNLLRGTELRKKSVEVHLNKLTEEVNNLSLKMLAERKIMPKLLLEDVSETAVVSQWFL